MNDRLILTLVAIAVLFLTNKRKLGLNIFIAGSMTLGILLSWFNNPLLTIGFYISTLSYLVIIIYAFTQKDLPGFEKLIIGLSGLIMFLRSCFEILHWPYGNETRVMMIIPVLAYLILIFRNNLKFHREYSFMIILVAESMIKFMKLWN